MGSNAERVKRARHPSTRQGLLAPFSMHRYIARARSLRSQPLWSRAEWGAECGVLSQASCCWGCGHKTRSTNARRGRHFRRHCSSAADNSTTCYHFRGSEPLFRGGQARTLIRCRICTSPIQSTRMYPRLSHPQSPHCSPLPSHLCKQQQRLSPARGALASSDDANKRGAAARAESGSHQDSAVTSSRLARCSHQWRGWPAPLPPPPARSKHSSLPLELRAQGQFQSPLHDGPLQRPHGAIAGHRPRFRTPLARPPR